MGPGGDPGGGGGGGGGMRRAGGSGSSATTRTARRGPTQRSGPARRARPTDSKTGLGPARQLSVTRKPPGPAQRRPGLARIALGPRARGPACSPDSDRAGLGPDRDHDSAGPDPRFACSLVWGVLAGGRPVHAAGGPRADEIMTRNYGVADFFNRNHGRPDRPGSRARSCGRSCLLVLT